MGTSDVKRYESDWDEDCEGAMHFIGMYESPTGDWVRYEDHATDRAALVAQLEEAERAQNTAAKFNQSLLQQKRELQAESNGRLNALAERGVELAEAMSQVAELTRERDEWRRARDTHEQNWLSAQAVADDAVGECVRLRTEQNAVVQECVRIALEEERAMYYESTTADVEQAKASLREAESEVTRLTRARDEARLRADHNAEAAQNWHSEVTRLTEALAAAEQRIANQRDQLHQSCIATSELSARAEAAEARVRDLEDECTSHVRDTLRLSEECAALRAELERLKAGPTPDWVEALDREVGGRMAAESRLAAANALLERCRQAVSPVSLLGRDLDAHLAAQPATAPALDEEPHRG